MKLKQRPLTKIDNRPIPVASSLDAVIDRVEARRKQAEFEATVRLAEQVFPREWNVRVEPYSDGVNVQVRFYVARGPDPNTALRNAIEWYQKQQGSRIIIPR
jgi:hypothetical protein